MACGVCLCVSTPLCVSVHQPMPSVSNPYVYVRMKERKSESNSEERLQRDGWKVKSVEQTDRQIDRGKREIGIGCSNISKPGVTEPFLLERARPAIRGKGRSLLSIVSGGRSTSVYKSVFCFTYVH